mgnify:CR=1 FL=1
MRQAHEYTHLLFKYVNRSLEYRHQTQEKRHQTCVWFIKNSRNKYLQ